MNTEITCTIGPSAVTGERCGKPAIVTWTGDDGFVYAECAEHYAGPAPSDRIQTVARVGDKVEIHRYGKTYVGTVVTVGKRGAVYAEFVYGNGAKRIARV